MRDKVKEGYEEGDYIGEYRDNRSIRSEEAELLEKTISEVGEDAKVLDLGCGNSVPFGKFFIEQGLDLTGVDIAENHVESAQENFPNSNFVRADFFEYLGEKKFDLIVSFYAIFHIPREEHQKLFEKINNSLNTEGMILVTMAGEEMDRFEEEIGGGEMVWSSHSQEKSKQIIEEAGFNIVDTYEQNDEEHHLWILAKKVN